jgi:uncharacterized phage protein (TIGR01671 family)
MSRQLKFRGIDISTGKMVFGGGIDTQRDTPVIINHGVRYFVDAKTVGQFIGVYDNEGVEIYTNDIVQDHIGVGVVEYVYHRAAFRVNYLNSEYKWFIDYTLKGERESIKVIGNVHQNTDLLNKGK